MPTKLAETYEAGATALALLAGDVATDPKLTEQAKHEVIGELGVWQRILELRARRTREGRA